MRTRVRRDTVYNYDELSDEAKQRVLEDAAQFNMETFDTNYLTDNFAETLREYGFPTDKIEWSLGHSQGDGVAFYGQVDVRQYLKKTKQLTKYRTILSKDPYVEIRRNSFGHHYSHWNTMTVEDDTYNLWQSPLAECRMAQLLDEIKDSVVKVSRELEARGYAEFDRVTSKEYIEEQIEANEYEFTSDGKII